MIYIYTYHRRKFRSQTSDYLDRWKSRGGKSQRREEERSSEKRKSQKKKMQVREGVEKSRNTVCFPMFWGSGGSKGRLAKAAGAEPSGQMRDEKLHAGAARSRFRSHGALLEVEMLKNCTPLWREAHVEVKR